MAVVRYAPACRGVAGVSAHYPAKYPLDRSAHRPIMPGPAPGTAAVYCHPTYLPMGGRLLASLLQAGGGAADLGTNGFTVEQLNDILLTHRVRLLPCPGDFILATTEGRGDTWRRLNTVASYLANRRVEGDAILLKSDELRQR